MASLFDQQWIEGRAPITVRIPWDTVTTNLLPSKDITWDVGSPALRWNTVYAKTLTLSANLAAAAATLSGSLTAASISTGTLAASGAITGTTATLSGMLIANGINSSGPVAGTQFTGSTLAVTAIATGILDVTSTFTGVSVTFSGTVTAATGHFTSGVDAPSAIFTSCSTNTFMPTGTGASIGTTGSRWASMWADALTVTNGITAASGTITTLSATSLASDTFGCNGATVADTLFVGGDTQTQTLSVYNNAKIYGAHALEFGANVAGKHVDAGKIGYQTFNTYYLDIVGAGTSAGSRNVRISDSLLVGSVLDVTSTTHHRSTANFWNLSSGYIALINDNTGTNWCKIRHSGTNVEVSSGAGNANWYWSVGNYTSWINPRDDNTWDLGSNSNRWRNLTVGGVINNLSGSINTGSLYTSGSMSCNTNFVTSTASVGGSFTVGGIRRDPQGIPYLSASGSVSVGSGTSVDVNWTDLRAAQNYAGVINVAGTQLQNTSGTTIVVRIDYWVDWQANGAGSRLAKIKRASDSASFALQLLTSIAAISPTIQAGSSAVLLGPGDYCTINVSQDSASTLSITYAEFVMTVQ
jgi:hypothetical protein